MKQKLLTVAIPAYNRPETIKQTLEILKGENLDLFTVLVSDDSSTSAVEEVVKYYKETMPNLRYKKNLVNLGYSANVAQLYDLADTRYVWFLCDDDAVNQKAVTEILFALKKYEPVVAIFNCTWDDSFGRRLTAGVNSDVVHSDIDVFDSYNVLMRMTFLSILVVEKSIALKCITNNSAYKDNVFIQLTLGLSLLSNRFKLCEISSAILHRNVGFRYGEFIKFVLVDHLKAVHFLPHKFDNQKFISWSIRHLPLAFKLYLTQKIGLFTYKGKPSKETLKTANLYYGRYMIINSFLRSVSLATPTFLIKGLYLLKLIQVHGSLKKGLSVYRRLVNRAITDNRKTDFTSYR